MNEPAASIQISPLEVMVLKKLVLINYALVKSLPGQAAVEQRALVGVLNDITLRADLANRTASPDAGAAT